MALRVKCVVIHGLACIDSNSTCPLSISQVTWLKNCVFDG